MLEVVIPYVEAAMPYVKSGAPYAAVSLAVLGVVTLVWQHRSRLQLMQELELAQSLVEEFNDEQKELLQEVARGRENVKQLRRQEHINTELNGHINYQSEKISQLRAEYAGLEATLVQERKRFAEQLQMLQEARVQMGQEFENLAQKIFEEKSEKFSQLSKTSLDQTLVPLRQQLKDFKSRVEDVYDKESRDRMSLINQIDELKDLNRRISEDAVNLTKALKGDNKVQGNWGEMILERLLEESGLRKGHEYETQVALRSADGRRRYPDVIVRLPDNKDIVIDAKVSLIEYERYYVAEDDGQKLAHLKAHIASVKSHVEGLSVKSYENLEGIRSLDFVLIFIPIETAFLLVFEHEPALFRRAYDKNIIVVSPGTLLATLRTVQSIWRYENQNRNAEEIAQQAGRIHDQIVRVAESLQDVGKYLGKAQDSWHQTTERLRSGRGNLLLAAAKLDQLGAKTTKQLPRELLADET